MSEESLSYKKGVKKFVVFRLAKQRLFEKEKNQDSRFPFLFI